MLAGTINIPYFQGIELDFAILCQAYTPIQTQQPGAKTIVLDAIQISEEDFKLLFYSEERFGLNRNNTANTNYISLESPFRSINGDIFNLLENIYVNAEECLGVRREAFTLESTMALNKEFSHIHTLHDLSALSVINSLTWAELINSIKNKLQTSFTEQDIRVFTRLGLNVIFKTPTTSVLPLTIKLIYELPINIPASV
jgi:hypothetical protein